MLSHIELSFFSERKGFQLKEGKMLFRVTVSNTTHSGQQQYALEVVTPKAPNQPPRAIIRPESPVHGVEGSRLTLDAEGMIPLTISSSSNSNFIPSRKCG